jgi:type IV pilus assembly protein PilX
VRPTARKCVGGFSMLLVLTVLVIMSILGLAVLRSSTIQERMTASLRDRSLAFQAAETVLRIAQDDVLGNPKIVNLQYGQTLSELGLTCAGSGFCNVSVTPPETPVPITAPDGRSTYTIEYLGLGNGAELPGTCQKTQPSFECERPMFRLTARGRGPGLSEVVIQANIVSRGQ